MNTELETAFLAAAVTLPALSGIEHRTGVSGGDNEPENASIIVHCPESDHVAGPLWRGTVVFRIETPAFDNARAAHDARLQAVRVWLDDRAAVTAAFELQGLILRGYHVQKSTSSQEGNRWVAEIEIVAGVDTSG